MSQINSLAGDDFCSFAEISFVVCILLLPRRCNRFIILALALSSRDTIVRPLRHGRNSVFFARTDQV